MENRKINKHRRKNKYAAPVGGVFIVLAFIGLLTVIIQSFSLTGKIMDNSSQLERFENIIRPVIMFDPVPFDSVEQADNSLLLQSSVWNALLERAEDDNFDYNDNGLIQLTASDVDVSCAKLFGASAKLNHQTFGDYEYTYYFDESTKTYEIPVVVQNNFYTPKIVDVSTNGDIVSLVVGYIPPGNMLTSGIKSSSSEQQPEKYMTYELKKMKKNYYINAIKYPPEKYSPQIGHEIKN